MAVRFQRRRTKGWRAPEGTVNCTRPSVFGNPFRIGRYYAKGDLHETLSSKAKSHGQFVESLCEPRSRRFVRIDDAAQAVEWYKWWIRATNIQPRIKKELKGKNLMCWCRIGQPCHADVLLEIANSEAPHA